MPSAFARHWAIDPTVTFLNHGSFGACPGPVLDVQRDWRNRMEAEPVRFLARELDGHLAASRAALGEFVGADPDDLAFVANATGAVNAVVRSLDFRPGDEILTTDHEYNAILNVLRHVAARDGARVVVVPLPFPAVSADDVVERVLAAVGSSDAPGRHQPRDEPDCDRPANREARRRHSQSRGSTRSSTAPTPRERCRWTSTGSPRRTTRATSTNGSVPRRAQASFTCGATGSRMFALGRSRTARTDQSLPGRASGSSSTGRERSTRRPGSLCRPRSNSSTGWSRADGKPRWPSHVRSRWKRGTSWRRSSARSAADPRTTCSGR